MQFTLSKKSLPTILSLLLVVGVLAFAANILKVSALVDQALSVSVPELLFGTVFPQERLDKDFTIGLSDAYAAEPTATIYAAFVATSTQGLRKNGSPVMAAQSNTAKALGAPQSAGAVTESTALNNAFSLGFGGKITLGFTSFIVNGPGNDLMVFEISPTTETSPPDEKVKIEAAQFSTGPWMLLAASAARDEDVDLGALAWAKYIRLTDVTNPADYSSGSADAYDVDGVRAYGRIRLGNVAYKLRQKPKCGMPIPGTNPVQYSSYSNSTENENGDGFVCIDEGYVVLPLLCPYLSKHEITQDGSVGENDGQGIAAFHGRPGPWSFDSAENTTVTGTLSRMDEDSLDRWNIDLKVPCFEGQCAQDWADFVGGINPSANPADYTLPPETHGQQFGCDLWIETTTVL